MDLKEIEREMNARLGPAIQQWYDQEILCMGRRLAAWKKMAKQWKKRARKGEPMTLTIKSQRFEVPTDRLKAEQPAASNGVPNA